VLVHGDTELVLVQALDERAESFALARVLLDVGTVLRHTRTIPRPTDRHARGPLADAQGRSVSP
jgi:hypothetical protein